MGRPRPGGTASVIAVFSTPSKYAVRPHQWHTYSSWVPPVQWRVVAWRDYLNARGRLFWIKAVTTDCISSQLSQVGIVFPGIRNTETPGTAGPPNSKVSVSSTLSTGRISYYHLLSNMKSRFRCNEHFACSTKLTKLMRVVKWWKLL